MMLADAPKLIPAGKGDDGPEELKTEAEILEFFANER
jgi:hypothetical protein